MRLPEIDYGGQVQGTAQTAALPYEAAAGVTKVIGEGLREYSKALIQAQQLQAGVRVQAGLNDAANAIKAKKFITEQELRDSLGGQVPPELADRIKSYPGSEIPMWAVGDTLFASRAQRLVDEAAKGIDGQGWQTHFKETIGQHVQAQRQGLAQYHLDGLDKFLQASTLQNIDKLVNAGDFEGAKAAAFSPSLPAELQVRTAAGVDTAKQEFLASKALTSTDVGAMKSEVERLKTAPEAMSALPDTKRQAFIKAIEDRTRIFEGDEIAQRLTDDPKNLNPDGTVNEGSVLKRVDAEVKDPFLRASAMDAVGRRAKSIAAGQAGRVDGAAASAIQAFTMQGPDGKPQNTVAAVQLMAPLAWAYLSSPASGLKGAEMKRTLEQWEVSARNAAKGERQLASDEQSGNYLELVSDMHAHPEKYRGMSAEEFRDTWMRTPAGQEPPLSLANWSSVVDLFARIKDPAAPVAAGKYDGLVTKQAISAGLLPSADGNTLDKGSVTKDQAAGVQEIARRVQAFVEDEVRKNKREPDGTVVQGFIHDQMQTQEMKVLFGLIKTKKTTPTPEPVTTRSSVPGEPVRPAGYQAPAPAPPAAPAPPLKTGSAHAPPPPQKTVVARRQTPSGVVVQYSDGTYGVEGK